MFFYYINPRTERTKRTGHEKNKGSHFGMPGHVWILRQSGEGMCQPVISIERPAGGHCQRT